MAAKAALAEGWAVARVVQPYRLAGRRGPAPTPQLDTAWLSVIAALRRRRGLRDVSLVSGGRSSGARVACRTATVTDAVGVIALAFPLHPPGRSGADRSDELSQADVPVLVVQGDRDAFGSGDQIAAAGIDGVEICRAPGADHSLRSRVALDAVAMAVGPWLRRLSR